MFMDTSVNACVIKQSNYMCMCYFLNYLKLDNCQGHVAFCLSYARTLIELINFSLLCGHGLYCLDLISHIYPVIIFYTRF